MGSVLTASLIGSVEIQRAAALEGLGGPSNQSLGGRPGGDVNHIDTENGVQGREFGFPLSLGDINRYR